MVETVPEKTSVNIAEIGQGQKRIIQIFASWCSSCKSKLIPDNLQKHNLQIPLYGIAYHDTYKAVQDYSYPYTDMFIDAHRVIGAGLGVSKIPAIYLVDEKNVIRNIVVQNITEEVFNKTILPFVQNTQG